MPEYDVHWMTCGKTRVTADTPEAARRALYDEAFSDDARTTDVVEVVPIVPADAHA